MPDTAARMRREIAIATQYAGDLLEALAREPTDTSLATAIGAAANARRAAMRALAYCGGRPNG